MLNNYKFNIERVIVFWGLEFLMNYHIFTYAQKYYNFYITLIVSGLVLLIIWLSDLLRPCKLHFDFTIIYKVFFFVSFFLLALFVKENSYVEIFGKYIPYVLWPVMFLSVRDFFSKNEKKLLLIFFSIFYTIGNCASIGVLQSDPEASRLLAGSAGEVLRNEYYSLGVGGYGYVYGSVLLLYFYLFWLKKEKIRISSIVIICSLISSLIMIFFANYTTALLLMTLTFLIWFAYNFGNRISTAILFVSFVLLYVFKLEIFNFLVHLFNALDLTWFSKRFSQLLYAIGTSDYDSLRRASLYQISLNSFLEDPFFGGAVIGGHSEVLDLLGKYGVFGFCFLLSLIEMFYRIIKKYELKYKIVFFTIIAFMIVNPLDSMVMIPMCTFVAPLLMDYLSDKESSILAFSVQ